MTFAMMAFSTATLLITKGETFSVTLVEQSTHYPKVEGSSHTTGMGKEEIAQKKLFAVKHSVHNPKFEGSDPIPNTWGLY